MKLKFVIGFCLNNRKGRLAFQSYTHSFLLCYCAHETTSSRDVRCQFAEHRHHRHWHHWTTDDSVHTDHRNVQSTDTDVTGTPVISVHWIVGVSLTSVWKVSVLLVFTLTPHIPTFKASLDSRRISYFQHSINFFLDLLTKILSAVSSLRGFRFRRGRWTYFHKRPTNVIIFGTTSCNSNPMCQIRLDA